jgi:beta-1,4-mannosyltransferase
MNENLNVLFMPKWDQANPYQRLLLERLSASGVEINIDDYANGLFRISGAAKQYSMKNKKNILHLHWLSPVFMKICWSKNPIVFYIKYFILYLDLMLCKFHGYKIVWTIHNKLAHEGSNKEYELILRRLIFRFASDVIVHSEEAITVLSGLYGLPIKDKATVIKHGNYIGVYPQPSGSLQALRSDFEYKTNQKVFLFFGAIKRYKGVETFIEVANLFSNDSAFLFVIAGEVEDKAYEQVLRDKISSDHLIFTTSFLDEQTLVNTIKCADAIVLPFSDTLTSGSMLLAMSLGKAIFLSQKGKVFGCVGEDYPLFFNSIEELGAKIEQVDTATLSQIGDANLALAKKNDWSEVSNQTLSVYLNK